MAKLRYGFYLSLAAVSLCGCASASSNRSTDGSAGSPWKDAGTAGVAGTGGRSGTAGTNTGGRSGTGGANTGGAAGTSSGTGGTVNGDGGSDSGTPTACDALGGAGVWQEITPPGIDLGSSKTPYTNVNFGTAALRLNPRDPAQIYLGTEAWGFYGSRDCGTTWTKLDTGRNGTAMDDGNQWTMVVDPTNPEVVYSNSGFAVGGVFKSTNGGVDWDNVLTAATVKGSIPYSAIPYAGFIGTYSMDPSNHLHVLSSFHSTCNAPAASMCFIETVDGGTSWTVRNIEIPGVSGGEHTLLEFLTSTRWLFGTQSGIYISDDSGSHWTQIPGTHSIVHHQQTYRTASGHYFQSTWEGLMYSPDGAYNTWTMVSGSPTAAVGVAGDGTHVWTSYAGPWAGPCAKNLHPYYVASEAQPGAMTQLDSPVMGDGGLFMAYDAVHHVLYSSNFCGGVWRVVIQ